MRSQILVCALLMAVLAGKADAQTRSVFNRNFRIGEPGILLSDEPVTWFATWPTDIEISVHDGGKTCFIPTHKKQTVVIAAFHSIPAGITEPYLPEVDRWVVSVSDGDKPDIDDNEDDEKDEDEEQDVTPPVISNTYKVGKVAYDAAVANGDKRTAAKLAVVWREAAKRLVATKGTEVDIQNTIMWTDAELKRVVPDETKWRDWGKAVTKAADLAWDNWRKPEWIGVYNEVASALEAASR